MKMPDTPTAKARWSVSANNLILSLKLCVLLIIQQVARFPANVFLCNGHILSRCLLYICNEIL